MKYITDKNQKISLISESFNELIGKPISSYELAQIYFEEDNEWSYWMDLPLFITVGDITLSLSWQKFDDLAIFIGRQLPFSLVGSTVRFIDEGFAELDSVIGKIIQAVYLGRGDMTVENEPIEIWTRILVEFTDGSSLEIFNALDENGIEYHQSKAVGEFKKCI